MQPLRAPAETARRPAKAPTPARNPSVGPVLNPPPDGDHPPLADGIDLRAAGSSSTALDAANMPPWMVDNFMQTSAAVDQGHK
jgi:hypothetical protein